jgi:hypothetical protein
MSHYRNHSKAVLMLSLRVVNGLKKILDMSSCQGWRVRTLQMTDLTVMFCKK